MNHPGSTHTDMLKQFPGSWPATGCRQDCKSTGLCPDLWKCRGRFNSAYNPREQWELLSKWHPIAWAYAEA